MILLSEQHAPTITAKGSIYVLSTPLAVGSNFVYVPQRMFHDEPENGVRLPPPSKDRWYRYSAFLIQVTRQKCGPPMGICHLPSTPSCQGPASPTKPKVVDGNASRSK